jgi:transposase
MAMLAESVDAVVGVDTHTDTHTACLLDRLGREVVTVTVPADPGGYAALIGWAGEHTPGPQLVWAVEGTRSHGVGLVRARRAVGQVVIEAGRPSRVSRRPGGKSDPADARRAARDALAVSTPAHPRQDGAREALRILLLARSQMSTTRTAAVNTFKALVLTAPDRLREQLRSLTTPAQTCRCLALRTAAGQSIAEQILRRELRRLARHIRALDLELRRNQAAPRDLVDELMPALLDQPGVGPMSAAQLLVSWSHSGRFRSEAAFAALAGVSPLEASSGRISRHRLNRFGDRQLNRALHIIVNWRMLHDPATRGHLHRRRAEQKTDPEIRRCLKRYTARALYRIMQTAARQLDRP